MEEALISPILTPWSVLMKGFRLRCEAGEEGKRGSLRPRVAGTGEGGTEISWHLLCASHHDFLSLFPSS